MKRIATKYIEIKDSYNGRNWPVIHEQLEQLIIELNEIKLRSRESMLFKELLEEEIYTEMFHINMILNGNTD